MSTENNLNQPVENQTRSRISNGTIINVVLFVGLIVLYTLNFTGSRPGDVLDEAQPVQRVTDADGEFLNIAYVISDTLMSQYKLAVQMREEFEAEQRRLDGELQRRQRNFQSEIEKFQNQIQTGAISMENAQRKEQELMQQRDELMQLNDTYTNRLMLKEMEMNTELYGKITELLGSFSRELGYDYILGFSRGGGILYAGEQHDITDQIVEKLNQEYDARR